MGVSIRRKLRLYEYPVSGEGVALALLTCLCTLCTGTSFVSHLPLGPSITASSAGVRQQWSTASYTVASTKHQARKRIHGRHATGRDSSGIVGSRHAGEHSEPTAHMEMVGAASSAAAATATSSAWFHAGTAARDRAQGLPWSTALGATISGIDMGGVPAKQRMRRVRHRDPSKARANTSATALKAKAVETAGAMAARAQEELAEREAIEAAIREDGAPTVVSGVGFTPGELDEDDEEEDEEDEEEGAGDEEAGDGDKEEGGDGQRGTEANAAAKTLDEEEETQDKEAAAIQKQGLKVGAFGKERLVYHNDYVVHEELGFCRYWAPEFTEEGNPDEIMLEFADSNMSIGKDEAHLLTRYRAADAASVPLSEVADQGKWLRHKKKVQERVTKQAINVMDLYAKRARLERDPCRTDGPEMVDFCQGFPHQPTSDQVRCLQEIENDMIWRKVPMDRLLCGDVGFGKTEVAIRAIFRSVRNNNQVALLAPTTILAAQHYRTLMARMPPDVKVALLRGGNTHGSQIVKEGIKNCTIDIVVGTHSLLSRKVEFPNLGLLVVDEEQKFGVNQKEKLKVLTTGVDVLTLTATPIPRTLHMSLTGIRDLSTIFSPPQGRQNVTTYIMKATDDIMRRALTREMARGGQVFVVVPRINQIEEAWQQITRCVPDAKIAIGHSKVKGLEDVVLQFTLGKGDVLLATSIIENGIDMPNVNSIVVMDSHMFGLSQLYQMRGRVGRSDVAAYTYLLYPPGHSLTNEAKRRLKAMRELSHLGSGFELANRDLEIRGAGNIFGTDQSGDLKDIGYELYMNMLEKAIVSVRGTDIRPVVRCEVDMGLGADLEGSLANGYMNIDNEERERQMERLRVCNSFRELVRIAKEWATEFGVMPTPVRRLFKRTHLHTACRLLGVSNLSLEFLTSRDTTPAAEQEGDDASDRGALGGTMGGMASLAAGASKNAGALEAAAGNGRALVDGDTTAAAAAAGNRLLETVDVGSAAASAQGGRGEEVIVRAAGDVPFAVLRGPEVEQERWEILLRHGPLKHEQLKNVSFRRDVNGVTIRGVPGAEKAWLMGDREQWLDHVLSVLLPLVEYVEMKQTFQLNIDAPPRRFVS